MEKGSFTMSGGEVFGNAAEGRAGGGVYIVVGSEFKKTGGVIGGNGVDLGYKGGQVFMAAGRNSRQRGEDAGEDVGLDSGSGENWDGR